MRTCKECGVEKPLSGFIKSKGYRMHTCRACFRRRPVPRARRYRERGIVGEIPPKVALCEICRVAEATDLDHCHDGKHARGWLCHNCNLGLGHFRDEEQRLLAAVQYLQARAAPVSPTS